MTHTGTFSRLCGLLEIVNGLKESSAVLQKRKRFEEEMRLMSYIRHRNIVRCYGGAMARTPGERDIMVLEYVAGGTLDAYIHQTRKRDRLRLTEVLSIAIQIADALRYLHPIVVHRDLKPSNIILDQAGVMKVRTRGEC